MPQAKCENHLNLLFDNWQYDDVLLWFSSRELDYTGTWTFYSTFFWIKYNVTNKSIFGSKTIIRILLVFFRDRKTMKSGIRIFDLWTLWSVDNCQQPNNYTVTKQHPKKAVLTILILLLTKTFMTFCYEG
jgi:hypothetical protein